MEVIIERSKKGLPCLWEQGGAGSSTGNARIIAGKNGEPKTAIYIRTRGELSNSYHALIPVCVGDYVIKANQHRQDFDISIFKIKKIDGENADTELINSFNNGEWEQEPEEALTFAISAAAKKASCYHCREPHYVRCGNE